jgi:hypothetical protein
MADVMRDQQMLLITVMSQYKIFIEVSICTQTSRSRGNVTLRFTQTPVSQSHRKWPTLETAQCALHDTSRANQKALQRGLRALKKITLTEVT